MNIQEQDRVLKVGSMVIPLSSDEVSMYKARRSVLSGGPDVKKSDENLVADVMWLNGNPGLPALLEFYKHMKESWFS